MGISVRLGQEGAVDFANAARDQEPVPDSRYGDQGRPNWIAIAIIIGAHLAALITLALFDVVELRRQARPPVLIMLQPERMAPPPHAPPPPPAQPHDARTPPPDAPPPIVTTTATSATPPLFVPPPVPAVVAVTPPTAPAAAPPAPPAPIVPPDASAATLRNPPPSYPIESRRRREQGTVRLRVLITSAGVVKEISVARSSGFARLDKAALDAVRRWRFAPGTQAGVPVEAVGVLSIPFDLT